MQDTREDLPRPNEDLSAHIGMMSSRNTPGEAHEKGAIESAHASDNQAAL